MATKVGEGYIEITARLVGFNQALAADVKSRLKALDGITIRVKPAIQGITKTWQTEIQREINRTVTGLTVKVKVVLDKKTIKADLSGIEVEAIKTGDNAGTKLSDGFDKFVSGLRRQMREAETSIRTGLASVDDENIKSSLLDLGKTFEQLSANTDKFSDSQVTSIRSVTREFDSLLNMATRNSQVQAQQANKAHDSIEAEIRKTIADTDKLTATIQSSMTQRANIISRTWSTIGSANRDINDNGALIAQVEAQAQELARALDPIGDSAGKSFSNKFLNAVGVTLRFGAARLAITFTSIITLLDPVISAISQLAAGLTELASSGFYAVGSLAALPAVFAALAQGAGVLGIALFGIGDALNALQNEQQHAALTAQTMATAQATAAKQLANAQQSLADAQRSATRQIADSQASLAKAQEDSAQRISDAIQGIADAQESATDRIATAQDRLAQALADTGVADAQARLAEIVQDSADQVIDAQQRVVDAVANATDRIATAEGRLQDAHEKTVEKLGLLADAYKTAKERIEDLRLEQERGLVDEDAARLAIEQAQQNITATYLDPHSRDLDKKAAEQAYKDAVLRLKEIQEKNGDLALEVAEADATGVEGSKEVTDAKKDILDAQQAEIDAEKDLAKARTDGARDIADAEKSLAKTRSDNAKQIAAAEKAITDARANQAKDIASAEKDLADARKNAARDMADAEKALANARKDADESIKSAEDNLAQAREDSARNIARAQDDVKDSVQGVTDSFDKQNAQMVNVAFALSQLSPAAQTFVKYLSDTMIPKLREVQFSIQDAFFPPIQAALERSGPLLDLFKDKLTTTADIFGTFAGKIIDWLNTPETLNTLGHIMDTNNGLFKTTGEIVGNLAHALLGVTDAAGPFLERMAGIVLKFSEWIDKTVNSESGRKELADFFGRVGDTLDIVLQILGKFGKAFYDIFKVGQPYGQELLTLILKTATKFAEWTSSTEGKNELKDWFERGKAVMIELGGLIEDIVTQFFTMSKDVDFAAVIKAIRDDLLPAIISVSKIFAGDEGGGLVLIVQGLALSLLSLAGSISLVSYLWNALTGDFTGATEDLANVLTIQQSMTEMFGIKVPDSMKNAQSAYKAIADQAIADSGRTKVGVNTAAGEMTTESHALWGGMQRDIGVASSKIRVDSVADAEATRRDATKAFEDLKRDSLVPVNKLKDDTVKAFEDTRRDSLVPVNKMGEEMGTSFAKVQGSFKGTTGQISLDLNNWTGGLWQVGVNVINGLINGINLNTNGLKTAILNLFPPAIQALAQQLGLASPSKLFKKFGGWVGDGLVIGITSKTGAVKSAVKGMADAIGSQWDASASSLEVGIGMAGNKLIPPDLGRPDNAPTDVSGAPAGTTYNVTLNAVPTTPTERQILNALSYADALYGS